MLHLPPLSVTPCQWWCEYEPEVLAPNSRPSKKRKQECRHRAQPYSPNLNGEDGVDKAARFLKWYIIEGHAGYKVGGCVWYSVP